MVNWGSGVVTLLITRFFASNFSPGFPDIITPEFGVQLHQLGIGGQRCWTEIRRQFATPRERTVSAARLQSSWLGDFHTPPKLGDWFVPFWGGAYFQGEDVRSLGICNGKGDCCVFFLGDGRWGIEKELVFFLGEFGRYPTTPPKQNYKIFVDFTGFLFEAGEQRRSNGNPFLKSFLKRFSEIVSQEVAVVIQSCSPGRGGDSFVFL